MSEPAEVDFGQYRNRLAAEMFRFLVYWQTNMEQHPEAFPESMFLEEWDAQFHAWTENYREKGG
jgi:hypothetical protein